VAAIHGSRGAPKGEVTSIDRVFETNRSFSDVVSFFDQSGYQVVERTDTPGATAWTVKRPDGTVAHAVVRNTRPTTFELVEVKSEP